MSRTALWYPAGVDFDGDPVVLHDATKLPMRVLRDIQGTEAAPWKLQSTATPGVAGGQFVDATEGVREVEVPVMLQATDRPTMRRIKAGLVAAMKPSAGPGRLVLTDGIGTDSGAARYVNATYAGGLEGDGSQEGGSWWRFTLKMVAFDPCWYSLEPATATWAGKSGSPFFPFGFPFTLAPAGMDVTTPLELDGDTESWGTFTLTGPFTRARFTNDMSGELWEVRRSTDTRFTDLVVSTNPNTFSLRTLAGVNAYSQKSDDSVFFPLAPGDTVSVEAEGTTSATQFDLSVPVAWGTSP